MSDGKSGRPLDLEAQEEAREEWALSLKTPREHIYPRRHGKGPPAIIQTHFLTVLEALGSREGRLACLALLKKLATELKLETWTHTPAQRLIYLATRCQMETEKDTHLQNRPLPSISLREVDVRRDLSDPGGNRCTL